MRDQSAGFWSILVDLVKLFNKLVLASLGLAQRGWYVRVERWSVALLCAWECCFAPRVGALGKSVGLARAQSVRLARQSVSVP